MNPHYLLLLCSIFWVACASPEETQENEPAPPLGNAKHVEVLGLAPNTFNDIIELTGTVEATHDVIVSSKTTGTLENIVALGRIVKAGEVVANTENDLLRASVLQAEAQVKNAEAGLKIAEESYERQRPLYADSIISQLEFIRLETTLDQAKSALAQANAVYEQVARQLGYTSVKAPINGKVEARYVEAGEQVVPGTQVLRLVDARNVYVSAGIPERYAGDIEIGTPAEINLPTAGISSRQGRVSFAGSVIDPDSRSFEINIAVENEDGKLKPEMIAELEILRLTVDSALVAPGNAVTRTENGHSVFIVAEEDGNYVAHLREVTLGAEYSNQVVILSGVSTGEQLVVRGQSTLADQDLVTVDQTYTELDALGIPVLSSSSDVTLPLETEL